MNATISEFQPIDSEVIPAEDIEMLARYLAKLKESADESFRKARLTTKLFYATIKKSVVDMTANDARAVIKMIQELDISNASKNTYFLYINAWVNRSVKELMADDIEIKNYFD